MITSWMIKIFCPDECLGSLLDVIWTSSGQNGYRGMILDIDNTLLPWAGDTLDQGNRLCGLDRLRKWVFGQVPDIQCV